VFHYYTADKPNLQKYLFLHSSLFYYSRELDLFALDIYFSMRSRSEVGTLKAALLYKLNLVVPKYQEKGKQSRVLFFVKIISSLESMLS
jgi:hypothetical protein